jgi:hypothetical protein
MKDPLIEHLAYTEVIAAWTGMIARLNRKLPCYEKREGLSEKDTSNGIQVYEREIAIYGMVIKQATAYIARLGVAPS